MNTLRIESYQSGQETLIYNLIKKVYDEFVSIDYCEGGNSFFYDWIQPSKIAERQSNQINIWVINLTDDFFRFFDNYKCTLYLPLGDT
jgi:predicted transcriptional regulator